jgi:hypothetical protein
MARERASIGVEIWGDADFRNLTPQAQALWMKLYTHPALNYCGVVDFHLGRLAALSLEQTPLDVMVAAQELSTKYWIVVDQDTDEVLVRGFLRHDDLLKQWRLAISAAKAYAGIGSNKIRSVVVNEIIRYRRENPDLRAWDEGIVKGLLKQPATDVREFDTELRLPDGQGFAYPFDPTDGPSYGQRLPQTPPKPQTGRTPAPAPTPTPAPGSNDPAEADGTDFPATSTARARVARLRVDFTKVHQLLERQAEDAVPEEKVLLVVTQILGRARPREGDRTGLVLHAIRTEWSEWSRLVFQEAS